MTKVWMRLEVDFFCDFFKFNFFTNVRFQLKINLKNEKSGKLEKVGHWENFISCSMTLASNHKIEKLELSYIVNFLKKMKISRRFIEILSKRGEENKKSFLKSPRKS